MSGYFLAVKIRLSQVRFETADPAKAVRALWGDGITRRMKMDKAQVPEQLRG